MVIGGTQIITNKRKNTCFYKIIFRKILIVSDLVSLNKINFPVMHRLGIMQFMFVFNFVTYVTYIYIIEHHDILHKKCC